MFRKTVRYFLMLLASFVLCFGICFGQIPSGIIASAENFSKTEIQSIISEAQRKINGLYDVDAEALQDKITQANAYLGASNMTSATQTAYEIMAMSAESMPVTARAVWHRPTEKSLEELKTSLDTYQSIGVNLVFVETFYHGYSMFKSDYVPYYAGFETADYGEYEDYLHAFASLAKERGIETHAWVENFYVGVSPLSPFLQEHSGWIMYNNEITGTGSNRDLTFFQRSEGGAYIFIDPANKNVCDFLIQYYQELLEKNPLIKGLNLDYIRYPVSSQDKDTGFTRKAMYDFAKSLGRASEINAFDPLVDLYEDFQKILNGNYQAWCDYRTGVITDFVKRIRMEVKGDSDLVLSTAVFSSLSDTISKKKQDWKTWFQNGWIDVATPMAYLDTSVQIKSSVQSMMSVAGGNCYYYTGLASSYRGFPAYHNVTQTQASYEAGAHGYVIFCATQVLGMSDVQQMLKLCNNGKSAVLPHADVQTVAKAYVDALSRRADEIYIPAGAMTSAQKTALMQKLQPLLAIDGETATELQTLCETVEKLNDISYGAYASGYAKQRITELMQDCYEVLSIQANLQSEHESLFPPKPPEEDSSEDSSLESSEEESSSEESSSDSSVEESSSEESSLESSVEESSSEESSSDSSVEESSREESSSDSSVEESSSEESFSDSSVEESSSEESSLGSSVEESNETAEELGCNGTARAGVCLVWLGIALVLRKQKREE